MAIAIIPARGGSKGLPGKNILVVAGKPLIAWTIEAALQSGLFRRVIVSTDSPAIAEVTRTCHGEVPFMRPAELAQDDTPGTAPVLHAVRWLQEHEGFCPDFVMLLQPTSPLRTAEDISCAMELIAQNRADAVVSVTAVDAHPYWMKRVDGTGRITDFMPLHKPVTRRQDLPAVYALNGAIYLIRRHALLEQETLFPSDTHALIMPRERSLDVDTAWDLYLADLVLQDRRQRESR
jgi:CMP-N,N'-diacetyllegionaminic acid synthase